MSAEEKTEGNKVADIDVQQSAAIEEYLKLRQDETGDRKVKRALKKAIGKLDGIYWKRVGALIVGSISSGQSTLSFSDEDRLLIDMGLLDLKLVEGADNNLPEELLAELNLPGAVNHYYLTEWLEDRYRRFLLQEQIRLQDEKAGVEKSSKVERLAEARSKIYNRLKPFFKGLPGVNEQIVQQVVSGKLDEQLLYMSIALLGSNNRADFLRRYSLRNLRLQIIVKLRARLTEEKDFKLLDMLDVIYVKFWDELYQEYQDAGERKDTSGITEASVRSDLQKNKEFLDSELKFAKSLLPLGALSGGVQRCCSVLLKNSPRITRKITTKELKRVHECDRDFTVDPLILIAPFQGRGFFEWDRDSMFVPLVPVDSPGEAVAHATGNFRMLIDSLQQDGNLKETYETAFSGVNFQEAFQKDYRKWVSAVGSGKKNIMADDNFKFFFKHVGPDTNAVLAPANLRNLGKEARLALRKRIEKQISIGTNDANFFYRLGVIEWQENNLGKAVANIAKSVSLNNNNGAVLFSLGLLLRQLNAAERANQAFTLCRSRMATSIWGVYAELALKGEIG